MYALLELPIIYGSGDCLFMFFLFQGNRFRRGLRKFIAFSLSLVISLAAFSEDVAGVSSDMDPGMLADIEAVIRELGLDDPLLDSPEESVADEEPDLGLDNLHENEREILEKKEVMAVQESEGRKIEERKNEVQENAGLEKDVPKVVETPFVPEEKPEPDGKSKKIDLGLTGLDKDLTQKYINDFLGLEGKKYLVKCLENSVPYRPYIIQKIKENNLPLYLQYLPIVESNYKVTAKSRSGATGMWQFMENSMAPLLKKSKWHDDRRDPWKSTDAAMLKLKLNYTMFDDWYLAVVAYNCGAGALQRIMKENPGLDFWGLWDKGVLKGEAMHYIPKLIAVADVVENADYYGLPEVKKAAALIDGKEVEEFDYLTTKAMLTFSQLSQASGVSVSKIKELNPALLSDCTPLGVSYDLRLPKGKSVGVADKLKKKGLALDSTVHKVEKGESLWGISRKYGITVDDLCRANGIKESSILSIGTKLVIPIYK